MAIAPALIAYMLHLKDGLYTQTVWGYCFIYCKGAPRPKNKIKQIQSSHLFCKPIVPLWIEEYVVWQMKKSLRYIVALFLAIIIMACDSNISTSQDPYKDKPYNIYFQDRNLCVTLPYPTVMLTGAEYWDIDLTEIRNELYRILRNENLIGRYDIYARFEVPQTDKYGNSSMTYNDKFIATIEVEEARKYTDSNYFNKSYRIESLFRKAAGLNESKIVTADPPTKKHGKVYDFFMVR